MSGRLFQSIFLIVGTAIGAGILALPISTVDAGFLGSTVGLLITWCFMTFSALQLVKARLCFSEDVDIATMTTELLGRRVNILIELAYLSLLLSLVSLYITTGSSWVSDLIFSYSGLLIPPFLAQISFTFIIAFIIYQGMGNLANINQYITSAKLFFLFMIIMTSFSFVEVKELEPYTFETIPKTLSMLLAIFGFASILPSLATHLNNSKKQLESSVLIGSIIILVCYILWEYVVFGVVGSHGLQTIANSQDKGTEVIHALSEIVNNSAFHTYGIGVIITAIMTSFLGVGHCLFSYLKDALPIRHGRVNSLVAIFSGFLTPIIIINIYPSGISSILGFAGIFVATILGILPSCMVLSKAYATHAAPLNPLHRGLLWINIAFFSWVIFLELSHILQAF